MRPSCPVAFAAAAGAWGGVLVANAAWLAARAGSSWLALDPRAVLALGCALACLALAALSALPGRARAGLALAAVGIAAGAAAGSVAMASTFETGEALEARPVSSWRFVVETDPQRSAAGGWHFEASVEGAGVPRARVWVDAELGGDAQDAPELPGMGSVVEMVGRWKGLDPDGEFDASLLGRGVASRVSAKLVRLVGAQEGPVGAVRALRAGLLARIGPYGCEARALACGVVCGMQAALAGFDAADDFSDLGLSHLVAVSGSHLAVVAALVGAFARRARSRPGARLAVCAAVLALYVAFTGLQPSAVRSWVMAVLACAAAVAGRRAHAVSAVALAALGMLLVDPACAAHIGFQLSVLSVVGLTLFAGLAKAWAVRLLPAFVPAWVAEPIALTLVAQAFTVPVALPAFGSVALLSPLANVLVGPLVESLLVVGLACLPLAALAGPAADAVLLPCDALAVLSCGIARLLASAPVSVLAVEAPAAPLFAATLAGASAVYMAWPRPSRRFAAALLGCLLAVGGLLFVSWRFFAPARVVVLDVGQGDAILVQDGPHAVLFDTGPDDAVCYALSRLHVLHLDAVVLTHTDVDHVGGLDDLAGRVPVREVVVAQGVAASVQGGDPGLWEAIEDVAGGRIGEVTAGDRLTVGDFDLAVLWPTGPVEGGENEDSVVAVARYGEGGPGAPSLSVLLTGDAEAQVVGGLVETGGAGPVDVLKVGHHGSSASVTPAIVEGLGCTLAVASAGEHNRYGHPSPECRDAAAAAGALFACTAECGDIDLRPAVSGVDVRCSRTPQR